MRANGLLVMGVSGCGKTGLGRALAERLGWQFLEADEFHSPQNIAKMSAGFPLTDEDRWPWLDSLHARLVDILKGGGHPVLACSALKESYRRRLLDGLDGIRIVFLRGSYSLILERMADRTDHYMKPDMLLSQFETLEEPQDALVLDIARPLEELVSQVLSQEFDIPG